MLTLHLDAMDLPDETPRPTEGSPKMERALSLLTVDDTGAVQGQPVPAVQVEATADIGVGGCLEVAVAEQGRLVLRIDLDPAYFSRREQAWFIRLAERIAQRRRLRAL